MAAGSGRSCSISGVLGKRVCRLHDVMKGRNQEKALRLAAGNQLQLAVLFLAEEANMQTLRAVLACAEPLENWHGLQNQRLRSTTVVLD